MLGLFSLRNIAMMRRWYGFDTFQAPPAGKVASDTMITSRVSGYFLTRLKPSSRITRLAVAATATHKTIRGRYGARTLKRPKPAIVTGRSRQRQQRVQKLTWHNGRYATRHRCTSLSSRLDGRCAAERHGPGRCYRYT